MIKWWFYIESEVFFPPRMCVLYFIIKFRNNKMVSLDLISCMCNKKSKNLIKHFLKNFFKYELMLHPWQKESTRNTYYFSTFRNKNWHSFRPKWRLSSPSRSREKPHCRGAEVPRETRGCILMRSLFSYMHTAALYTSWISRRHARGEALSALARQAGWLVDLLTNLAAHLFARISIQLKDPAIVAPAARRRRDVHRTCQWEGNSYSMRVIWYYNDTLSKSIWPQPRFLTT